MLKCSKITKAVIFFSSFRGGSNIFQDKSKEFPLRVSLMLEKKSINRGCFSVLDRCLLHRVITKSSISQVAEHLATPLFVIMSEIKIDITQK